MINLLILFQAINIPTKPLHSLQSVLILIKCNNLKNIFQNLIMMKKSILIIITLIIIFWKLKKNINVQALSDKKIIPLPAHIDNEEKVIFYLLAQNENKTKKNIEK